MLEGEGVEVETLVVETAAAEEEETDSLLMMVTLCERGSSLVAVCQAVLYHQIVSINTLLFLIKFNFFNIACDKLSKQSS